MAYDEGLAHRVMTLLSGQSGLVEKKMFGGVGFIINGNMACGVNKDDLIVRVGPDNYEQALSQPNSRPFDFTGRPMKGWVMVDQDGISSDQDLQNWVAQGVEFAQSLPPK